MIAGLDFDEMLNNISSRVFTLEEKDNIYENVRKDIKRIEDLRKNSRKPGGWVQSTALSARLARECREKAILEALLKKWIRNLDRQKLEKKKQSV